MNYLVEITPFWNILVKSSLELQHGDRVLFKSNDGIDLGRIVGPQPDEEEISSGDILRLMLSEDTQKIEELREYEEFCAVELKSTIQEFKLDMKIVFTHCQYDENRVIFYFTAEKKVKFRKLHRYISQKLNKRIVIKQIGARDFARLFGGIGPCGRNLCCNCFLTNLKSISLRMAREQKIYVSPSKLSGICGKLLCCLNFEEDFYADFKIKEGATAGEEEIQEEDEEEFSLSE
jgi:cell fate regulator YaaT (PSP1 superfamily)